MRYEVFVKLIHFLFFFGKLGKQKQTIPLSF